MGGGEEEGVAWQGCRAMSTVAPASVVKVHKKHHVEFREKTTVNCQPQQQQKGKRCEVARLNDIQPPRSQRQWDAECVGAHRAQTSRCGLDSRDGRQSECRIRAFVFFSVGTMLGVPCDDELCQLPVWEK